LYSELIFEISGNGKVAPAPLSVITWSGGSEVVVSVIVPVKLGVALGVPPLVENWYPYAPVTIATIATAIIAIAMFLLDVRFDM
jgi:hypothetical protein